MTIPAHLEPRRITGDEVDAYIRDTETLFNTDALDAFVAMTKEIIEPERCYATRDRDRDRLVGVGSNASFTLSLPGGRRAAVGAVTSIAVATTHRRQGLAATLMRRVVEDTAEHGESLSVLTASEGGIYGRFGYGPAFTTESLTVASDRVRHAYGEPAITALARTVEPVDVAEAKRRFPAILDDVATQRGGMVIRDDGLWRALLDHDVPEWRGGRTSRRLIAVGDRGYALYRLKEGDDDVAPDGEVYVTELVARDPEAEAALWTFLASIDLTTRIVCRNRPADDGLRLRVSDVHAVQRRAQSPVYVRLVDLPTALEARGYEGADALVFEIDDPLRPANAGRWRLEANPDGAACARTDDPADVSMDAQTLGAAYLGGVGFAQLAGAGRVTAHTPTAVARAHRLFTTARAPMNTQGF